MEEDKTVKVRVVGGKVTSPVDVVIVVDNCANLHGRPDTVLDNGAIWVAGGAGREWKLVVAVKHALRPNHDEMKPLAWEKMCKLDPNVTGKRGLGTGAQHEYSCWWRLGSQALDGAITTRSGWVKSVTQSYVIKAVRGSFRRKCKGTQDLPLKLFNPSVVKRPPLRMLYGLSSCSTLPMVTG